MKRGLLLFVLTFALNVVWENLHAVLYASYKGGMITEYILLRASLFDAVVITGISLPFLFSSFFKKRTGLLFLLATAIAIANEWYGLGTGRWVYAAHMPVVPLIDVGLSPMFQLGILSVLSLRLQEYIRTRFA